MIMESREGKKNSIIYPSDLEPLYNPNDQFDCVQSATICAYKAFKFCNKFDTTTDMSKCPPRRFMHYISYRIRKGIRYKIIVNTLIAMIYRYQ